MASRADSAASSDPLALARIDGWRPDDSLPIYDHALYEDRGWWRHKDGRVLDEHHLRAEYATAPPASGPGCERHQGDPHNLCQACWALEPDPKTPDAMEARAAALVEYGNSLPDGVTTEAFAEASNLRREAQKLRDAGGEGDARSRPPLSWEGHGDLMRTQLQETGRIRIYYITLADLWSVVSDLGIDPDRIDFRDGYAVVRDAG